MKIPLETQIKFLKSALNSENIFEAGKTSIKMQSFIWILCSMLSIATLAECSWGTPGSGQYHIQTDEGPERYFRFQTDNGQFRKEKRLQDGTVIGTEAWIDAAGFLRQKDYIADIKGYRILKSKTVFVGQGRPIEDAIKSTKSIPAQSGILVDGSTGANARTNSIEHSNDNRHGGYVYSTTPMPPPTTAVPSAATTTTSAPPRSFGYLSPQEAAKLKPSPYLGYDHYPDELTHRHLAHPDVHIRPHSEPIDASDYEDEHNALADHGYYTSTALPVSVPVPSLPSLSIEAPLRSNYRRVRPIAVSITTPTPSPITAHEAVQTASTRPSVHSSGFSKTASFTTPSPGYYYAPQSSSATSATESRNSDDYDGAPHQRNGNGVAVYSTNTRSPIAVLPLDVNSLEVLQPPHLPAHYRRTRPQAPPVQSNNLGSDYEPSQNVAYDGVAVTRNGFRYYLPQQYHEEEEVGEQKRAGSFGYVDPFGIRRVIYYNSSPDQGFVHRKNNRYVGFSSTPYDPRPY